MRDAFNVSAKGLEKIGIKFSENDVVNIDDWIPAGECNPHNVRPFLLHDHGFVLAIVFADCLRDALDIAADKEKLDSFKIENDNMSDYEDDENIDYLGNDGKPFDIENVDVIELENPPRLGFAASFQANSK